MAVCASLLLSFSQVAKPRFLYHASPNRNITLFEPRADSIRDPAEGPVVFATPDKTYASMFLVPTNDSWTSKGRWNGGYYEVISDAKRYHDLDKGGAIYTLPADTFSCDLAKSLGDKEWVSRQPVKPVAKVVFASGLEAMCAHGVKVVFVTPAVFTRFRRLLHSGKIEKAFSLVFTKTAADPCRDFHSSVKI